MSRVYVGNLGDGASKRELEREFESFGPLRDVWVARNPPGFAFVVFEDKRDAEDAVNELDGRVICGAKIRVELARGPTRGGRAARLGLTEKCYECGRIGHYARDCTRRPGFNNYDRPGRRSSRSRSPPRRRRRYSASRSRSPPRRRERSRSYERSRPYYDRTYNRSRSRSRSRSPSREHKSYSHERSPSPHQDRNGEMKIKLDKEHMGDRSRSASPVA